MTEPEALQLTGKRTRDGAIKVTDLLEKKGYAPIVGHYPPLWELKAGRELQAAIRNALVPIMSWSREIPEGTPMTDLDCNAAYVAAAASADFAHGELKHTGPPVPGAKIRPGYYLVDAYHWGYGAPGHPLGSAQIEGAQVWVTAPTYTLLRDLCEGASWTGAGYWPDATVHDAWVADTPCRLSDWTTAIRDMRGYFMEEGDEEGYEALKFGYSQAVQMWMTPPDPKGTPIEKRKKHNRAFRPDWYHTLRAQHAFNMWRRAWIATEAGHPPVAVGGSGHLTDGMAFTTSDLTAVLAMARPPFRIDSSRRSLGTMYATRRYIAGDDDE